MLYILLIFLGYFYGNYMQHKGYQAGVKDITDYIVKEKYSYKPCSHYHLFTEKYKEGFRKICFGCREVISNYK